MSNKPLKEYKFLFFDVYGTLIDWESGIYNALLPLLSRTTTPWTRKSVLTVFASVESDLQAKSPTMPYSQLLAEVYKTLSERIPLASIVESTSTETALEADLPKSSPSGSSEDIEADANEFSRSLANWPPFSDTVEALSALKRLGFKLVILSNVDDASIQTMTLPRLDPKTYAMPTRAGTGGIIPGSGEKSTKLGGGDPLFAEVLTAQQLGAYKPDPRVLTSALETIKSKYGVSKDDVLMVAQSLFHDHVPAKALGLATVWINRQGSEMGLDVMGRKGDDANQLWDWEFETLGEMAGAVETEKVS